jgi:thymidylate kinase
MGKLIVLSGLDASGKSTQIDLIKKALTDNNLTYVHLHFPMYET